MVGQNVTKVCLPALPDVFSPPSDVFFPPPDVFFPPPDVFSPPPDVFSPPPDVFSPPMHNSRKKIGESQSVYSLVPRHAWERG